MAPWLARSGSDWLDLAAPGALAGSICLPWSPLGALTGSIWLQTTAQTTRLAKKNDWLIDDLPRRCLLRSLCNDASCLKPSIYIYISIQKNRSGLRAVEKTKSLKRLFATETPFQGLRVRLLRPKRRSRAYVCAQNVVPRPTWRRSKANLAPARCQQRHSRANLTPSGHPNRRSRVNLTPSGRPELRSRVNLTPSGL